MSICLKMSVHLSVVYVCLPACVSVVLSIYISVSIYLSLCLSIYLSTCVSVSIYVSSCLSIDICRQSIIHSSQHVSMRVCWHVLACLVCPCGRLFLSARPSETQDACEPWGIHQCVCVCACVCVSYFGLAQVILPALSHHPYRSPDHYAWQATHCLSRLVACCA